MTNASNKPAETRRLERGHDFYPTAQQLATVPKLYGSEKVPAAERVLHLHYFTGGCDWWLAELDRDEWLGFGYVCLNGDTANAEWGYVSLPELEQIYRPGGRRGEPEPDGRWRIFPHLIVERDLHWTPRSVADAHLPGRAAM